MESNDGYPLVSDVDGVEATAPPEKDGNHPLVETTQQTPPVEEVDPYDLIPTSVCSLPCQNGEIMIMSTVRTNYELFNIHNFGMPTRQHQKEWGCFITLQL